MHCDKMKERHVTSRARTEKDLNFDLFFIPLESNLIDGDFAERFAAVFSFQLFHFFLLHGHLRRQNLFEGLPGKKRSNENNKL